MRWLAILIFCWAQAAMAVEPDEMLADPALEARAQALDVQLRCVKCQSESIASSNAPWAKTARIIVRERLVAGDSDQEVIGYFVERYGDYVRMNPRFGGTTLLLWLVGPIVLLLGGIVGWRTIRAKKSATEPLSAAEQKRLQALMED